MQRERFLGQAEVQAFIQWLVATLPTLEVELRFKPSKFVPGGLTAPLVGFEQVLGHYRWCAAWQPLYADKPLQSDTWSSTRDSLRQLRDWLVSAVASDDQPQVLQACLQVLRWGGVRGAIPFLNRMAEEGRLAGYLREMRQRLALDAGASLDELTEQSVERFDAGLTKIHALLDSSGSPIYDSRVGAAISMLHAVFRLSYTGPKARCLVFPTGDARGDQIRNPGAFTKLQRAPNFFSLEYYQWARAQLQLGWIIREVLERTDWFMAEGDFPARSHAFEACLFMLGYDLRCLNLLPMQTNSSDISLAAENIGEDDVDLCATIDKKGKSVPTSHPFVQVLQDYLRFREDGHAAEAKDFQAWMQVERRVSESTARSYCYPFREFDLWKRSLEELRVIAQGGEAALYVVQGDDAAQGPSDELEGVCLVAAWLAGQVYEREPTSSKQRAQVLIDAGFAGTPNSANTLLNVGRQVGTHLALLDAQYQPTALYRQFFSESMSDLSSRLSVSPRKS